MISGYGIEVQTAPGVFIYAATVYPQRKRLYDPETGELDKKYLLSLRQRALEKAVQLGGIVRPLGSLNEEEMLIELEQLRKAGR